MTPNLKSPVYIIGFAGVVSAVFTAAVMALHVATAGQVSRNEQAFRQRAIVELFAEGLGVADPAALPAAEAASLVSAHARWRTLTDPETGASVEVVTVYRDALPAVGDAPQDGATALGHAVSYSGVGFWAPIEGLLGLSPDFKTITGLVVLKQSETPGLGGRITEPEFRRKFKDLKATLPEEGRKAVYIGGGKPSGPQDPRSGRNVDAITGATQTSLALERLLNASLARFHRAAAAAGLLAKDNG
jgi:Na+-transporting NADH:ubiquinone oxidoreductase subunit C